MDIKFRGMSPLLNVFDMPASLAFLSRPSRLRDREHVGRRRRVRLVWLQRGGVDLMLNTAYETAHAPPSPDPARTESHRRHRPLLWVP